MPITPYFFVASSVLFILTLKNLSTPKTAQTGFYQAVWALIFAILATFAEESGYLSVMDIVLVALGAFIGGGLAYKLPMTSLPQLVAGFHSFVGLASVFIALIVYLEPQSMGVAPSSSELHTSSLLELSFGSLIGAITFTGSLVAFGKLQGILSGASLKFKHQHFVHSVIAIASFSSLLSFILNPSLEFFVLFSSLGALLGWMMTMAIGGADMPVIVSMLNSYSGWAACGIGFTLGHPLLLVAGPLVGASGAILSYIMCKGMNRSFIAVLLGGFGQTSEQSGQTHGVVNANYKAGSAEDAAFLIAQAQSVIIIPGYGMAVAQAQHALQDLYQLLSSKGLKVRFAIHPVAGRMPGHMNVLLAEAKIPYEAVLEQEEINGDFVQTDIVLIVGANDITNPLAKTDSTSALYGMPILEAGLSKTVLFIKRSMSAGYAGIDNPLFYQDNTMMLFGDAKKVCEELVHSLKSQE